MSWLAYCNPFLPERIEFEREALGEEFASGDAVWNVASDWEGNRPNIQRLRERSESIVQRARHRLTEEARVSPKELGLYEDLVVYALYYRVQATLREMNDQPGSERTRTPGALTNSFLMTSPNCWRCRD
jgi:hypothetical protein